MHIYDIGGTLINLHQITHIKVVRSDGSLPVAHIFLAGQAEPIAVHGSEQIDKLISRVQEIST